MERMRITSAEDARTLRTPEHRVFWTSRTGRTLPTRFAPLKRFFVSYARHHLREFPWRNPRTTPFKLLIAEMLLAQTKAEDVAQIWPVLVARYPQPDRLARARLSTLRRLLRPLGFHNQRAKGLKNVARFLEEQCAGVVPSGAESLLQIPHLGLYSATAVGCFKFGERVPIVDANVIRVLGRFTGYATRKDLRRSRQIWSLAWAILPRNAVLHNYGLLDFAATVCTTHKPKCDSCELRSSCHYACQELATTVQRSRRVPVLASQ